LRVLKVIGGIYAPRTEFFWESTCSGVFESTEGNMPVSGGSEVGAFAWTVQRGKPKGGDMKKNSLQIDPETTMLAQVSRAPQVTPLFPNSEDCRGAPEPPSLVGSFAA